MMTSAEPELRVLGYLLTIEYKDNAELIEILDGIKWDAINTTKWVGGA